ncbi:MAG: lipoate--protein ligase family protein [Oscillatoriales cyanobacterium SM2_1_8]|nr:lipoate--protein ligase family protein [Oscillatoriales cyanobacterium SM2_1_8]
MNPSNKSLPPEGTTVRLIPYHEATGGRNMAIDAWLFQDWAPQHQRPVLRFYGWQTPTLSLGFHQDPLPGVTLPQVKRPTGGRAVLHGDDLCYAVVVPTWGVSRRASYEHLCRFLTLGLAHWGLTAAFGTDKVAPNSNSPNCFAGASAADLQVAGRKLVGSAQAQRRDWLLQHGSVLRGPDRPLWQEILGQAPAGLDEWLQPVPSPQAIAAGLAAAAVATYGWVLEEGPLTMAEWSEMALWEEKWLAKTSSKY